MNVWLLISNTFTKVNVRLTLGFKADAKEIIKYLFSHLKCCSVFILKVQISCYTVKFYVETENVTILSSVFEILSKSHIFENWSTWWPIFISKNFIFYGI